MVIDFIVTKMLLILELVKKMEKIKIQYIKTIKEGLLMVVKVLMIYVLEKDIHTLKYNLYRLSSLRGVERLLIRRSKWFGSITELRDSQRQ